MPGGSGERAPRRRRAHSLAPSRPRANAVKLPRGEKFAEKIMHGIVGASQPAERGGARA